MINPDREEEAYQMYHYKTVISFYQSFIMIKQMASELYTLEFSTKQKVLP